MITLQKTHDLAAISVPTAGVGIEDLLSKEWLLTNNRGGYSSSTIVGCNTRRYHGLLIGSLNPPVNRIMALASCLEMVISNGKAVNLSTFEFDEKFSPRGYGYIKQFRQDTGVHFDYQLVMASGGSRAGAETKVELTKSVYLLRDSDTVALVYDFTAVQKPVEFVLRPFVGLRDFHSLQKSYARLYSKWLNDSLVIRHDTPESCRLSLSCPAATFESDKQWWFNFLYRQDKQRGQDFTEDLWTPGFFKSSIKSPCKIVFRAALGRHETGHTQQHNHDIKTVCRDLRRHQNEVLAAAKTSDKKFSKICLAADQFITKRKIADHQIQDAEHKVRETTTILAGFPWFADWGRDAFISLPGLLLETGRFEDAKSVLTVFAAAADDGMIPNRFDDFGGTAHFNSVDASLWFINAAFEYLRATSDSETFTMQLLPIIRWIIDSYQQGNCFGICADSDGLITAGDENTQLTWMDAKYDGVAFTARYGKAVEINALWYNSLMLIAQFYTSRDMKNAEHYKAMAEKSADSFSGLFWNQTTGHLNDCILPDGSVDSTLRPNQIFAVSLPFSPLSAQQQKCVVDVIARELLTPFGLRTLSPRDTRYKENCTGPQSQRDEAYHQGTVWPYLIGPFVESYLKVNDFSSEAKSKAAEFIEPLMQHLTENACLGQISEIFDGDWPHTPRGCIAQAWSVAELIRAYRLVKT